MKTTSTNRPLIALAVLLFAAFCLLAMSATAQITLTGKVKCGPQVTGLIYFKTGEVAPINIRGKRKKYKVTIDGANADYLLTFNSGGVVKAIYIHTQQPDGYLIRQTLDLNILFTQDMPATSVVYYSPSSDQYIWRQYISEEDRARLKDLNLFPRVVERKEF